MSNEIGSNEIGSEAKDDQTTDRTGGAPARPAGDAGREGGADEGRDTTADSIRHWWTLSDLRAASQEVSGGTAADPATAEEARGGITCVRQMKSDVAISFVFDQFVELRIGDDEETVRLRQSARERQRALRSRSRSRDEQSIAKTPERTVTYRWT